MKKADLVLLCALSFSTFQALAEKLPDTFKIPKVVGSKKSIVTYLTKKERLAANTLVYENVSMTEASKSEDLIIYSKNRCNTDSCRKFIFVKNNKKDYKLIGIVSGRLMVGPHQQQGVFEVTANSKLAEKPNEIVSEKYVFNGQHLVPTKAIQ